MKTVSKICLLSMATLLAACNEQISPELQKAGAVSGSTGGSGSGLGTSDSYYFKLTNTSSVIRNFKLHKTGNNNLLNDSCRITNSSKLSVDNYKNNRSVNDITCYFDAEELALRFGGFSWEIEASPNTCEFIRYSPFSYYNRMPGTSFGTYNKTICETGVRTGDFGAPAGYSPNCNSYRSDGTFQGLSTSFTADSDEELCRFNYKNRNPSGPENCDDGGITIKSRTVTKVTSGTPPVTTFEVSDEVSKTISCGGKAANCISGPIKEHSTITGTKGSILVESEYDKVTKYAVTYPSLYPTGPDNYHYANFRRDIIHKDVAFTSSYHDYKVVGGKKSVNFSGPNGSNSGDGSDGVVDYTAPAYLTHWGNLGTDLKTVTADEVERFSRNLKRTGNTKNIYIEDLTQAVAIDTDLRAESIQDSRYTARPNALEPFVGLSSQYETNPFYTFTCLDNNYETKARIRVFVREWDKIIPTTNVIENVTDVHLDYDNAFQDTRRNVEADGSNDESNDFNDVLDWDDIISIDRTVDAKTNLLPIFKPTPSGVTYVDVNANIGFFDNRYFPQYTKP